MKMRLIFMTMVAISFHGLYTQEESEAKPTISSDEECLSKCPLADDPMQCQEDCVAQDHPHMGSSAEE